MVGRLHGGVVEIEISNPVPDDGSGTPHRGSQIAQENIRQRLRLAFGESARMETALREGQYHVALRYPGVKLS